MCQIMTENEDEEMIVTPWKVSGEIDYSKLVEQFGTQMITEDMLHEIQRHTGDLHSIDRAPRRTGRLRPW